MLLKKIIYLICLDYLEIFKILSSILEENVKI